MTPLKIHYITGGYHHIMLGNKRVGTIERCQGGYIPPRDGTWFAYESPSTTDDLEPQFHRFNNRIAVARTMRECLKKFAENTRKDP